MRRKPTGPAGPRFMGPDRTEPRGATKPRTIDKPGEHPRSGAPHRYKSPRQGRPDPELALIWGFHPVREALRSARRTIVRLSATEAAIERLQSEIAARELAPVVVSNDEIAARLPRDAVHQGVLLEARPLAPLELDDLPREGTVLVLDQVTDPHNVGAILRTAAAFGLAGLVTTERHSPEMAGVLAKAASGALEHVPIVSVVNLARALEALGDRGYQRIGLDSDGAMPLQTIEVSGAMALVLGAEGKGLRRLTRENCDVIGKLDLPGAIKSLNVSNACAAALTMLHLRRETFV